MNNKLYYIWLSLAAGPASRLAPLLLAKFKSPENVYNASAEELSEFCTQLRMKLPPTFADHSLEKSKRIMDYCERCGVSLITPASKDYPPALLRLLDMPILLYCKGRLPDLSRKLVTAVVGTRKMTDQGRDAAYKLGSGLALGGACVVSGGALGIDGMALSGAISSGGPAVAILGSGIDIIYPSEHKRLFGEIEKCGAVLTEYPPSTPPNGRNFPQRNRIISGMSNATVVVEADKNSGALITAKLAIYQGSDLYAVPGNIDSPTSEGTNNLIKNGARAVTSAEDILKNYTYLFNTRVDFRHKGIYDSAKQAMEKLRVGTRGAENSGYGRDNFGGKAKTTVTYSAPSSEARNSERDPRFTENGAVHRSNNIKRPSTKKNALTDDAALARRTPIELGDAERAIYRSMKAGVPTLVEELEAMNPKIRSGDMLASLTILELCGMIECGKGGYFLKVTEFDDGDYSPDNE